MQRSAWRLDEDVALVEAVIFGCEDRAVGVSPLDEPDRTWFRVTDHLMPGRGWADCLARYENVIGAPLRSAYADAGPGGQMDLKWLLDLHPRADNGEESDDKANPHAYAAHGEELEREADDIQDKDKESLGDSSFASRLVAVDRERALFLLRKSLLFSGDDGFLVSRGYSEKKIMTRYDWKDATKTLRRYCDTERAGGGTRLVDCSVEQALEMIENMTVELSLERSEDDIKLEIKYLDCAINFLERSIEVHSVSSVIQNHACLTPPLGNVCLSLPMNRGRRYVKMRFATTENDQLGLVLKDVTLNDALSVLKRDKASLLARVSAEEPVAEAEEDEGDGIAAPVEIGVAHNESKDACLAIENDLEHLDDDNSDEAEIPPAAIRILALSVEQLGRSSKKLARAKDCNFASAHQGRTFLIFRFGFSSIRGTTNELLAESYWRDLGQIYDFIARSAANNSFLKRSTEDADARNVSYQSAQKRRRPDAQLDH